MHVCDMSPITPSQAEELVLASAHRLEVESVALRDSLGRILRKPLVADRPFPPFDRVTMDGIAFQHDERKEYALHGLHPAGSPLPEALPSGSCWQIMTGAALPPDCDTVVPYEEIELRETHARLTGEATPGIFIHREGTDAKTGDELVKAGTRIGPAHLGLAASVGAVEMQVARRPKIAILSTGDELVLPEEQPETHQLRQSNGLTLKAAIERWGAAEISLLHLADDLAATTDGIRKAMDGNDLVIISGGISKGRKDFVLPAMKSLVGDPLFHGVLQRPGKPLAFWPGVAALPGNPNSTLTTFHRYLIPLLNAMSGTPQRSVIKLPFETEIIRHPRLTVFVPCMISEEGKFRPLVPQNSGDFVTPLSATGFAEVAPGSDTETTGLYRAY